MAEHAYTDEELSDKIMAYIYETGGCDDIGVTMQERYGIKLCSIADIITYRRTKEKLIEKEKKC